MGFGAGLKLRQALPLVTDVLGIEAVAAAQALDLRAHLGHEDAHELAPSPAAGAVLERIRRDVAFLTEDRMLSPDLAAGASLVGSGELLAIALETL